MPDWPCFLKVRFDGEELVLVDAAARLDRAERRGQRLAVQSREVGLGVEGIEVARPAGHEQEDDALGRRLEVRLLRRERIGGSASAASSPSSASIAASATRRTRSRRCGGRRGGR